MFRKFSRLTAALALVSFAPGCWIISNAVDAAVTGAVRQESDAYGRKMAAAYSPMLMQAYVSTIMAMAFQSGGYAIDESKYEPGQYTRWEVVTEEQDDKHTVVERAFLGNDKEGNQWWKVKFIDNQNNQTAVLEALFNKDRTEILRMRAKLPDDKEGKEMPVQENSYYVPPTKLTRYSLEGAFKGSEKVSVPAGTFTAKRYEFGYAGSDGSQEWYAVDGVPGGSVKFVAKSSSEGSDGQADSSNYVLVLSGYGDGAVSELGVK